MKAKLKKMESDNMRFDIKSDDKKYYICALSISIIAILLRILFWTYTNREWEDSLITALHVENFWHGKGLTHDQIDGKPVQGFSSPIGMIVPLIGGLIDMHGGYCLEFIRLVSALAGGACVFLISYFYKAVDSRISIGPLMLAAGYVGVEHHQILWGMAGMETTLVTLTLLYIFWACARQLKNHIAIGMALALYARPDFLFLDIIVAIYCFFIFRLGAVSIIIKAAIGYLPWFLFAWIYYGNPIPNTIYAKFYGHPMGVRNHLQTFIDMLVPLGPSFAGHGTGYWRDWDNGFFSVVIACFFLIGALNIIGKRIYRMYVPVFFVIIYYLYYLYFVAGIFGWYLVPVSAATIVIAGYGLYGSIKSSGQQIIVAFMYTVIVSSVLPGNFKAEFLIQNNIENKVRKQIGLYLHDNQIDSERVLLEPLGYVAYYSRKPVIDYPGLASREMVDYLRDQPYSGLCSAMERFRPEYLLLRPYECSSSEFVRDNYFLLKTFKTDNNIDQIKGIQHNIDIEFLLYKIKRT